MSGHVAPRRVTSLVALLTASLCACTAAFAQSATWTGGGGDNFWGTGGNWSGGTVPGGTATFNTAGPRSIDITRDAAVGTMKFGGVPYTFNIGFGVAFFIDGKGILSSGGVPTFNNDNGFLILANKATAGNAFIRNFGPFGQVAFIDAASAGNSKIINVFGGDVMFGAGSVRDTATAGNAIIINKNLGATTFLGNSSAGNATIINNAYGFTDFGEFSTAGNATVIANHNSGGVAFFDNSTGGNARFIARGRSFIDFAETRGKNDDGKVEAGSIEGDGYFFLGGNELTVGSNNRSTEVKGIISDGNSCGCGATGGSLVKTGFGTLTLSGNNTYTGQTTVDRGALIVNGSIVHSALAVVNSGALLGGTGILPSVLVNDGGILSPGQSIGTLDVRGNLVLATAARYLVEMNAKRIDLTRVTGTARLSGILSLSIQGFRFNHAYTFLRSTGGVSGRFNRVVFYHPALNAKLNYTGNSVSVTLTPKKESAEVSAEAPRFGIIASAKFLNILTSQGIGAGRSFGSGGGDQRTAYAADEKASAPFPPDVASAFAAFDQTASPLGRWSMWGTVYADRAKLSGSAAVGTVRAQTANVASGFEYRPSGDINVGFGISGGTGNVLVTGGAGKGDGHIWQFGAYGGRRIGDFYVEGAASYTVYGLKTERSVAFPGLAGAFSGDARSYGAGLRGEAGYRLEVMPSVNVVPFAAWQGQRVRTSAYREQLVTGSPALMLQFAPAHASRLRSEAGVGIESQLGTTDLVATLFTRAAWAHEFIRSSSATAAFQAAPGNFSSKAAKLDANVLLGTFGANVPLNKSVALQAKFDGELGRRSTIYTGTGSLRVTW